MAKFMVVGGNRLQGKVTVSGSKNACLPILAATLLYPGETVVHRVPQLRDVEVMCEVLQHLGAKVVREGDTVIVNAKALQNWEVNEDMTRRMRASNLVLGPLLGRYQRANVSYPGGCDIGSRPMNLHLKGMAALGARITERFGYILAETTGLYGTELHLDMPSVGATENMMMAAVLAAGTTLIRNAAREPEIVDLQNFLNQMGADIRGAGSDVIKIKGVRCLRATEHTVIPDRIEAGTHMIAAVMTGGDVTVSDVIPEHLDSLTAKLKEIGAYITVEEDSIRVVARGRPRAVDVKTLFYPGFPTDLQPQLMALLTIAEGTSIITEMVFENRYKHVSEFRRMGADITVEGQTAIIKGVHKLSGAVVEAPDLRAGAALVLAALGAENGSIIENIEHIDRGYECLERKYNALGARMIRVHS